MGKNNIKLNIIDFIIRAQEYGYSYISYTTPADKHYKIIFRSHSSEYDSKFLYIYEYCKISNRECYVSNFEYWKKEILKQEIAIPLEWIDNLVIVHSENDIYLEYIRN